MAHRGREPVRSRRAGARRVDASGGKPARGRGEARNQCARAAEGESEGRPGLLIP